MNNKDCKTRPEIINITSNEPSFYPYSIKVNKCSGSCNNINNPYLKLCVPDIVKNINVKVFNLMSRTNETRHTEWHETCKGNSCTIYIVLLVNFFLININISCAFVYFYWYLEKGNIDVFNINANTETAIY